MTLDIDITDMFCGCGGSTTGAVQVGVNVRYAINHWDRAIETHNTNYPNVKHVLTDLHVTNPKKFERTTGLIASPECFPAGTLILCKRGLIPIEDVCIGDEVLTHQNRWQLVTQILSRTDSTLLVRGQGHSCLEVTAEHPFYVREQQRVWDNDKRDYNRRVYSDPLWVASHQICDKTYRWATPVAIPPLLVPSVPGRGMPLDDPEFWWLIGRWLGDGTVRIRDGQGGEITLVSGNHKADVLEQHLAHWLPDESKKRCDDESEMRWRRRTIRTATLFECGHQGLALWIVEHFGKLAHGKRLPAWIFSLSREHRQALLDGYISADGHVTQRATIVGTISKQLALGIRLLVESLGYRASLLRYAQHTNVIEVRTVNTRDQWVVRWENNASQRTAFADDTFAWSIVKATEAGREEVTVYNLSVAEDESYVADGIVVHNCTNHSLAKGKRRKQQAQSLPGFEEILSASDEAAERSRCTMWTPLDWAEHHKYEFVILENVVDVGGWAPFEAWLHAWQSLGYDFQLVPINSMHAHPTPQSRDRIYFVAWRKGNRKPDLSITPRAYCHWCGKDVDSIRAWKKPDAWTNYRLQCGKYDQQYVYVCPECNKKVTPYYYAAINAIDWSIPARIIRDRDKPLAPKTLQRVEDGLKKFQQLFTVDVTKSTDRFCTITDEPFSTQTKTNGLALVVPHLINLEHTAARPVSLYDKPFPTQTRYDSTGLVTPPFMMDHLAEYRPRSITGPVSTICAAGNHHSVILPPGWEYWIMTYYGNGQMVPVEKALPTVATRDHHAFMTTPQGQAEIAVEDCGFRMLNVSEIKAAMAFPTDYLLTGNRKEQVEMLGNAVTPPVMKLLVERVLASLA